MSDQDKGLYNKYRILHRENGAEVEGAYFVLQPDKDAAARPALLRYAEETAGRNDELSADLWKWIQSIDPLAECPEDEYPLLDGSTVILAPGDRVFFLRSRSGAMPLTIDPDSIMDDVLQAYKSTLLQLGQVTRERDAAQQAVDRHRKVLTFYGEISNYELGNYTVQENGSLDEWESLVQQDEGKLAREAYGLETCCFNPDIQTITNQFVTDTAICVNCGKLAR